LRKEKGDQIFMTAPSQFHLSFAPGVTFQKAPHGQSFVHAPHVRIPIPEHRGILEAIARLARAGATEKTLLDLAERSSRQARGMAATQLTLLLFGFSQEGLLCRGVLSRGKPLVTLQPLAPGAEFTAGEISRDSRFVLSRFAWCRREAGEIVLESPLAPARVVLHSPRGLALLGKLARPCQAKDLTGAGTGLGARAALAALELLWNAGALSAADENGAAEEDALDSMLPWEFHDLLFHTRSRQGRHAQAYGATDRLQGRLAPLPALKPPMSADAVDLPRPDLAAIERNDPAFTRVLEQRRSSRRQGRSPITLDQLGEFLYRTARVRGTRQVNGEEYTERVYPSAGGAYELEFYLVIRRSAALAPGLYHYHPAEHRLYRLPAAEEDVERLLASAAQTAHCDQPQVLVVLAARFARLTRRYQSLAYAMILKDVGVVFQTMYLVATAMGLAACALGGGDSDLFARAAALHYYAETSVAEFMLGSAPQ
jgi:SagB-type dehydrogenase family enzyme